MSPDAPAWQQERQDGFRRGSEEGFRKAVAAGVKIAMGSDASVLPQGENAKEIVWMASHGMTPLEAIRAATVNAAELLGWSDRVGSIAPGKYADIIAVRGNPLRDVATLERVAWVMKGGVVFKDALGIAKVQEFVAARKRGDEAAASALMAPDARIWWEAKTGPGEPWTLGGKWNGWDSYFHSTNEYSDWRRAARLGDGRGRRDERLLPADRSVAAEVPGDVVAGLVRERSRASSSSRAVPSSRAIASTSSRPGRAARSRPSSST